MELPFITLDVFTTTRYRGNPLAIVTIPASVATPPSQAQKQAIAAEFKLSETVFVHEPREGDDADADADADAASRRIDIFTPGQELPFAGHPTIGTAVSLLSQGVTTLVAKAGPIPVVQTRPGHVQAAIPHNVHLHAKSLAALGASPALGQLSADPAVRQCELRAPLFSIVNGMTFILIELPSLEVLATLKSGPALFPARDLLDDGWQESFIGKYYYVRTAPPRVLEDGATTVLSIRCRMLSDGLEDPATGSAACALSSFLTLDQAPAAGGQAFRYEIDQGVEMGRESNIVVDVSAAGDKIDSVKLSGTACQVMRGTLTV